MPHVLANEDSDSAEPGLHLAQRRTPTHEPLFVEHAVGRQKELSVDVRGSGVGRPELQVSGAVEVRPLTLFIEAHDAIDVSVQAPGESPGELSFEFLGAERHFGDPTLDEVPGGTGFRKDHQVRPLARTLEQQVRDSVQVLGDFGLLRGELSASDRKGHEAKCTAVPIRG